MALTITPIITTITDDGNLYFLFCANTYGLLADDIPGTSLMTFMHYLHALKALMTYVFFEVFECVSTRSDQETHKVDIRMFLLRYHDLVINPDHGRPGNQKQDVKLGAATVDNPQAVKSNWKAGFNILCWQYFFQWRSDQRALFYTDCKISLRSNAAQYVNTCTVKPVLRDHCHDRPPVLKDPIFLAGLIFQCCWTTYLSPKTACLERAHLYGKWGVLSREVLLKSILPESGPTCTDEFHEI